MRTFFLVSPDGWISLLIYKALAKRHYGVQPMTATTILPGDTLTVYRPHSPHHYTLTEGEYRLVVVRSLAAKLGFKFACKLYGRRSLITTFIPDNSSYHERGYLFLGRDKHPVHYSHEPNLTARLEASLEKNRKSK